MSSRACDGDRSAVDGATNGATGSLLFRLRNDFPVLFDCCSLPDGCILVFTKRFVGKTETGN